MLGMSLILRRAQRPWLVLPARLPHRAGDGNMSIHRLELCSKYSTHADRLL